MPAYCEPLIEILGVVKISAFMNTNNQLPTIAGDVLVLLGDVSNSPLGEVLRLAKFKLGGQCLKGRLAPCLSPSVATFNKVVRVLGRPLFKRWAVFRYYCPVRGGVMPPCTHPTPYGLRVSPRGSHFGEDGFLWLCVCGGSITPNSCPDLMPY